MESGNAVSPATGTLEVIKPQFVAPSTSAPNTSAEQSSTPASLSESSTSDASSAQPAPDAGVGGDAVAVSLSAVPKQASQQPSDSNPAAPSELTRDQAQKLAEQYQAALNKTSVRFGVTIDNGGTEAISFQVIDKETGKVVRQFPADSSSASKISDLTQKGALVDESS